MHRLFLNSVGPIKHCDIEVSELTVFTGAQASGKSTIAKSIFFFRTIKDDILDAMVRRSSSLTSGFSQISLHKMVTNQIRNKYLQIFGTSRAMSNDLRMKYCYSEETYIEITLRLNKGDDYISPNYVYVEFSKNIEAFLNANSKVSIIDNWHKQQIKEQLSILFADDFETIFIPAGRSLITLLTTQLNYIFTVMDEEQKRSIDFCTQKYVERILKIRNSFDNGVWGYFENKLTTTVDSFNVGLVKRAMLLIDEILKGRYLYVSGEERLVMDNDKYVKINYTSSGQQETVWIFNILMYQLINNTKTFIILEEPEAHLYPDAQKKISELLALFKNAGNSVLLTTHSPYILGALNNLLFAHNIASAVGEEKVLEIVSKEKILVNCASYFVEHDEIEECFDNENNLIKNEVIDGASKEINEVFDQLIALEDKGEKCFFKESQNVMCSSR